MFEIERVKKVMRIKGYNQKELAEKSHITEASLSKYLNGTRQPRNDVIFNLAKALDTTVDFLLGNDEKSHNAYGEAVMLLTRAKKELTEEERIKLINILLEK